MKNPMRFTSPMIAAVIAVIGCSSSGDGSSIDTSNLTNPTVRGNCSITCGSFGCYYDGFCQIEQNTGTCSAVRSNDCSGPPPQAVQPMCGRNVGKPCGASSTGTTDGGSSELPCGILKSGQKLAQGQHIAACHDAGFGTIELDMQNDGNFVLYQKDVCAQPLWASSTVSKGYDAIMQTDGDLVVVNSSGTMVWHSNTGGNPGATLSIQDDGNLVIYTTASKAIWSSGTWHEKPTKKLWIAQDGATANSDIEKYWRIVLEMSLNFGRMEASWPTGRALAFGGYKVLGSACSVVHTVGAATVSDDSATMQCIENQTGWNIASGDVILYYPQGYGCEDGRNHWDIPVTHDGTSSSVVAAYGFTGSGSQCQQALGSHEVYEASSQWSSADCCNGQGCPATPSPWGWYSFSMCGSSWWAQTVAPTPSTEYTASACTKLQF